MTTYVDEAIIRREMASGTGERAVSADYADIIRGMAEEASCLVDEYKGVERGAYAVDTSGSTEVRYYFGSGSRFQKIEPFVSVSTVEVEETNGTYTEWTQDTDYYLWPYNYAQTQEPVRRLEIPRGKTSTKSVWTRGARRVKVTGYPGITSSSNTPETVKRAVKIQVQRWYHRAMQGWQDAGGIPDLGQVRYIKKLDPEVEQILGRVFPHKKGF